MSRTHRPWNEYSFQGLCVLDIKPRFFKLALQTCGRFVAPSIAPFAFALMLPLWREAMKTPLSKKHTPEETSAAATRPLMADGAADDAERRESRRRERDERRRQREERIANSLGSRPEAKSQPKMPCKEQAAKDATLGCCHRFRSLLVKLVHVLDALAGLTFSIYGALIATQFEEPATGAVVTTLTYGSAMLFASIMGAVSFYSPRYKRLGLLISAYSAPIIAFFYIVVLIAELSSSASIFDYLTEHMDVLYLNEAEIGTLKHILPLFFVVLVSLTAIEICRFLLLSQVRERLVRFDATNHSSKSSKKKKPVKKSEGAGSIRSDFTEPMLVDEEAGARAENGGDY